MSESESMTTTLERINQKCKEAKRILDKPVKLRKGTESRWGGYISEYNFKGSGKVGSSMPGHDQ